jgi:hypothetical protein
MLQLTKLVVPSTMAGIRLHITLGTMVPSTMVGIRLHIILGIMVPSTMVGIRLHIILGIMVPSTMVGIRLHIIPDIMARGIILDTISMVTLDTTTTMELAIMDITDTVPLMGALITLLSTMGMSRITTSQALDIQGPWTALFTSS